MEGPRPPEPREAAAPPHEGALGAVSVHRCPHCHADVALGKEPVTVCGACLAPHHAACWGEGGARCGACRGQAALVAASAAAPARPRRRWQGWVLAAVMVALGWGAAAVTRSAPLRTTSEIQLHLIEDDLQELRERWMHAERAVVIERVLGRFEAGVIPPGDPRQLLLQEARQAWTAAQAAQARMDTTEAREELDRAERRLRELLGTLE